MKFCTKCGWEIKDDQSFCPNCGTAVGEQPSSYQQPAPTNSTYYVDTQPIKIGKTKRIIITILLALALVGILSNAFDCFEVATVLSDGGASAVKHQASGGGADGHRQAERLAEHLLAVQIGIVLVTAGGLLVTELKRALEGCKRIESSVGYQRICAHTSGSYHTSLKFSHQFTPPFVICASISSSV